MTETIDKYKSGIIAVIGFLAGVGLFVAGDQIFLTQEQIDNAYVCTSNEKLAICPGTPSHPEPLSPSALSCYYTNDEPRDTYTRCSGGVFMPLVEYADLKGVTIDEFLQGAINEPDPTPSPEQPSNPSGKQQICNQSGCVDKK